MPLLDDLIVSLREGKILKVLVGLHWTAVGVDVDGEMSCGLATTLRNEHDHHSKPDIPRAGELETIPGKILAMFANSDNPTERSVGVAAINALLPVPAGPLQDLNAEEVITSHGAGKSVVLIGRFPFVPRLRKVVGNLIVLEQNPDVGERPESEAEVIIPDADVVAITGMTLINRTLDDLLAMCSPAATVILLGPSTPLSSVLFNYGVDIVCGSLITNIQPVLQAVGQGANFRQVHRAGVRLISMLRSD